MDPPFDSYEAYQSHKSEQAAEKHVYEERGARSRNSGNSGGGADDSQLERYKPSVGEYTKLVRQFEYLHKQLCKLWDPIENLNPGRPSIDIWEQIWLTFIMAGEVTENSWAVVGGRWLTTLKQRPDLGPGKWQKACAWVRAATDTIEGCKRVLQNWPTDPRQKERYCRLLYGILSGFPLPKRVWSEEEWRLDDQRIGLQRM
ncbi:hypothetical protein F4778DRAFT_724063 [Xylariomycetidae sp. FL2044]|nr:hypothetical protein F4778DRAFT_724063 [Xylariomycetidae sp. FL2044]